MPRGFSEGFLKPKKEGKGDPRLKYKVGDILSKKQTVFERGIQTANVNLSYSGNGLSRTWGNMIGLIFASFQTVSSVLFGCFKSGEYGVSSSQAQIDQSMSVGNVSVSADHNGFVYAMSDTGGSTGGISKYTAFSATPVLSNTAAVGRDLMCDKIDSLYYRPGSSNNIARMNFSLAVQWTKTDVLDSGGISFYKPVDDGLLVLTYSTELILRKYDKTGALVWTCPLGGSNDGGEIQVDGKGDIYVGRVTRMAKVSKDGALIWQTAASYITNFSGRNFTISDATGLVLYSTQTIAPYLNGLDAITGVLINLDNTLGTDSSTISSYTGITEGSMKAYGNMLYYYTNFMVAKLLGIEIKA